MSIDENELLAIVSFQVTSIESSVSGNRVIFKYPNYSLRWLLMHSSHRHTQERVNIREYVAGIQITPLRVNMVVHKNNISCDHIFYLGFFFLSLFLNFWISKSKQSYHVLTSKRGG